MGIDQTLQPALVQREADRLYRRRRVVDETRTANGGEVVVDGRVLLNFCSNDYLGLAGHPRLVAALQRGADRYGAGSGAAHLVTGHSHAHHALEEELAAFTGRERALLFSTGYMANLGVISALCGRGDTVLEDRLNHASLLDGALLSRARLERYPHAASDLLAGQLAAASGTRKLVVTDGVFSMDGDLAPLPALAGACREHGGWLMVDDAHAIGVIGENGRGSCDHYGLDSEAVPILMATLGKGLGSFGAFVAGSEALIETLIQQARPYIYTTAMPAAQAEVSRESLRLVDAEAWRRDHLQGLIGQFRSGAEALGLPLLASPTAIQPLLLGTAEAALAASEALYAAGIWVSAIRPPTVPAGSARLRITLSAAHSEAQVERLLEALSTLSMTEPD